jgi:hypothetical protein
MKLYEHLRYVAVIMSTTESDGVLCEVRAEAEKTADDGNITIRDDRI